MLAADISPNCGSMQDQPSHRVGIFLWQTFCFIMAGEGYKRC